MPVVERRVVTVLFADLVGFTTLSENLDPEDVAAIQERYFALARDVLDHHGGRVEKYIGDAVFGAFGVTHASGHDATDAVSAGLAIVVAVHGLGLDLGLDDGLLEVRVGVTTGTVVVTHGTDTRSAPPGSDIDWRLTGDVVNVAARLQGASEPGAVLVDAATALAVESGFDTVPAGALELKGKAEPVPAWWVRGPHAGPAGPGHRAALVGRVHELNLLGGAMDPGGSRRRAVLAPPGVGKTRLVLEFADRARAAGHPVRYFRVPAVQATGYEPVAGLMHAAGVVAGADLERFLARGAEPGPRERVAAGHVRALLSGEPLDATPAELFTSWSTVLAANAAEADAVWILDDAHLVGPDLVAFLTHVTGRRGGSPLVVCAGRTPLPLGWSGEDVLHLDPLDRDGTAQLLDVLLGEGVLPPRVRDAVLDAAGGNPLFVEELIRTWTQAGTLRTDDGRSWHFTGDGAPPTLPLSVHAIYLGQLDGLGADQRRVVTTGSVPGRTFPARAIPELGVPDPVRPLARLADAGLLLGPHDDPLDSDSYTYRHAVLRDVAYASLARAERASLHLRFARWAQRREPFPGVADLVAGHLDQAYRATPALNGGDRSVALADEAARWLERSAVANLAPAPQRAVALLRRAVELTGPAGADRTRRRLVLAEALRRSGALVEAMEEFAGAAGSVLRGAPVDGGPADGGSGDDSVLVDAALGYEQALLASRLPRSRYGAAGIALLTAAAQRCDGAGRARVLAALGQAHGYGGDPAAGAATCEEALALARSSGDPGALATALLAWRTTRVGPQLLPQRLRAATAAVEAARRDGDPEAELEAARLRMLDLLESGDAAGATDEQQHAAGIVDSLSRPLYSWYPAMWVAMRALLGVDPDAGARLEEFREQGERWGYADAGQVYAVQLLHFGLDHGLAGSVLPRVLDVIGAAAEVDEQMWLRWHMILAHAHAVAGRPDIARRALAAHADDDFARVPDDLARAHHLCLGASAAHRLGDVYAASRLREMLRPWAGQAVVLGSGAICLGAADHFLGLAAATVGDLKAAAEHQRAAIAIDDAMGARGWAVRSRVALAAVLRRTGEHRQADELDREAEKAAACVHAPALTE